MFPPSQHLHVHWELGVKARMGAQVFPCGPWIEPYPHRVATVGERIGLVRATPHPTCGDRNRTVWLQPLYIRGTLLIRLLNVPPDLGLRQDRAFQNASHPSLGPNGCWEPSPLQAFLSGCCEPGSPAGDMPGAVMSSGSARLLSERSGVSLGLELCSWPTCLLLGRLRSPLPPPGLA